MSGQAGPQPQAGSRRARLWLALALAFVLFNAWAGMTLGLLWLGSPAGDKTLERIAELWPPARQLEEGQPSEGRPAAGEANEAVEDPGAESGRPSDESSGGTEADQGPDESSTPSAGEEGRDASAPGASTAAPSQPRRRLTATPPSPIAEPSRERPAPVDWPEVPDLDGRTPLTSTQHFRVFAAEPGDALLEARALRWAPELESILSAVSERMVDRGLADPPIDLVFADSYSGRCPARGLANVSTEPPLLMVFVDAETSETQIRAVLAHEMAHHLSLQEGFIGDGVLTEGIANWAAGPLMLAWQGYPDWDSAVRDYVASGRYISITDDAGLSPEPGEACLARRDRVYNARTSFTGWLIERIGLEQVLAMPLLEIEAAGEPDLLLDRGPDYELATGLGLADLERAWLADIGAGRSEAH